MDLLRSSGESNSQEVSAIGDHCAHGFRHPCGHYSPRPGQLPKIFSRELAVRLPGPTTSRKWFCLPSSPAQQQPDAAEGCSARRGPMSALSWRLMLVPHPLKNAPTAPFAIRSRPLPSRHREVRTSRGMGGRPPPRRLSTMNTHTDVRPVVSKGYPFRLTVALPR